MVFTINKRKGKLVATNFPTKSLLRNVESSACIFQVVSSISEVTSWSVGWSANQSVSESVELGNQQCM